MKNKIAPLFGALRNALVFIIGALIGNPASHSLGVAALPVIPTADNTLAPSLAVATAIKPTETVGSLLTALLQNKNTSEDRMVLIHKPAEADPARAIMLPDGTISGTHVSGGQKIGVIVRDDATKETTTHSFTPEGGLEDEEQAVADAIDGLMASQKPKRNLASLVNAIADSVDGLNSGEGSESSVMLIFRQNADGTLTVYHNAAVGSLSGKVADVTQEAAASVAANPLW